ncbi:MAG: GNAT family N-acetyltransferase [Desulfobacula sp.]|jgi:ribosomal protein S18 acetylase RimI-like enzyme
MPNKDIRLLEEITLNAWPALQTLHMDGWVVRFANGYTKRANCVNPLYASVEPLKRKIEACEKLYFKRGLKSVFKITPASLPAELDAVLAGTGYGREARTGLQVLSLDQWALDRDKGVELYSDFAADWHGAYCMMNGIAPEHHETVGRLLELQFQDKRLAVLRREGKVVACGLGVKQDRFLGIFDIVVNPKMRRQGFGKAVVEGLLAWGKQEGARTAYLQVTIENEPARKLYDQMGFHEEYQYWYRVKGAK